jgi:hypothetical protein
VIWPPAPHSRFPGTGQLTSLYDQHDLGPELGGKLAPVLTTNRVTAWWWGHQHRAMTFRPFGGVQYPRCLSNGGIPVLRDPALTGQGRTVADWESRRYIWSGLRRWARSGFAVIDLAGDTMRALPGRRPAGSPRDGQLALILSGPTG